MSWRFVMTVVCLTVSVMWTRGCQSYPFELRLPERVDGHKITQQVATKAPTDILFIIDNSGSMLDERTALSNNIQAFIDTLSQSSFDFHVGIVTTDVECNVPERSCPNYTSLSCCAIASAANLAACQELDLNGDGKVDWSNCDGGRLRAPQGLPAYWTPPVAANANQWAQSFAQMILDLGCQGSGLESGLEAARRAINCSVYGYDPNQPGRCPSAKMAQLNAGFIRAHADLVLIFVTDEDDCSYMDPNVYLRPVDASDPNQQAGHLCAPTECYAYYGKDLDRNNDGLQDWADPNTGTPLFRCEGHSRGANPPYPIDTTRYLDALVAAKGGDVRRIRAAGIVSGISNPSSLLGLIGMPCTNAGFGPTDTCECWSANAVAPTISNFYCALTAQLTGGPPTPSPQNQKPNECSAVGSGGSTSAQPGCSAMPGSRYVQFLEQLYSARRNASVHTDTLANSICQPDYSSTMFDIVNNIILTSCFELGQVPPGVGSLQVSLNGNALVNVPPQSGLPGWSWIAGTQEICLEGGLRKNIGDEFDIFIANTINTPQSP